MTTPKFKPVRIPLEANMDGRSIWADTCLECHAIIASREGHEAWHDEQSRIADETLMTVAQVAKSWSVSKMTVYRLCESNELASVRIGGQFRIKVSDYKSYMEKVKA